MKKDISSKILEAENDVFADIFNTLLFGDNEKIIPDYLEDEPSESFYIDKDGNPRNMYRDIYKRYSSTQQLHLVSLGIENESKIERHMPIRVMGYAYTHYKKQLDEYNNNKRTLLKLKNSAKTQEELDFVSSQLKKLGEFVIIPTLTLVLCYDNSKWNQPKTLKGLTNNNPYAKYMQDYGITVIDIKHLPKDIRQKFSSDFKYIANLLSEGTILEEDKVNELAHPLETLDMLIAYSGDTRYKEIRKRIHEKSMEGAKISMKEFLDELERNRTIADARTNLELGIDEELVIKFLMKSLSIDQAEATDIFNNKVKTVA